MRITLFLIITSLSIFAHDKQHISLNGLIKTSPIILSAKVDEITSLRPKTKAKTLEEAFKAGKVYGHSIELSHIKIFKGKLKDKTIKIHTSLFLPDNKLYVKGNHIITFIQKSKDGTHYHNIHGLHGVKKYSKALEEAIKKKL